MIPANIHPLLLTSSDGALYSITKSVRFKSGSLPYLKKANFGTATDGRKFTLSVWVKRGALANTFALVGGASGSAALVILGITSSDAVNYQSRDSSGIVVASVATTNAFTDTTAHYHVVISYDSTQATASDRLKIFVNGVSQALSTATAIPLNAIPNGGFPTSKEIGAFSATSRSGYFDGYMSEMHFIDGQALDATNFGQPHPVSSKWIPKAFTGTYGNNGFYLDFEDASNLASLGLDKSGRGNDFTVSGLSLTTGITYDWMDDTPTDNFATLNPATSSSVMTLSGGNLDLVSTGSNGNAFCNYAMTSGKWYCEVTMSAGVNANDVGISPSASPSDGRFDTLTGGVGYLGSTGNKSVAGTQTAYGATYTAGDIIGIAYDADIGQVIFYKNGVSQGVAASGLTGDKYFASGDASSTSNPSQSFNFGQRPFSYTPPTGFKALSSKNRT